MGTRSPSERSQPRDLPVVDDSMPVPVFDCQVLISGPDEQGLLHGRVANLAGVGASGGSERDVLQSIVKQFKALVVEKRTSGEDVPWIDPPSKREEGERLRLVPVHL